MCDTKYLLWGRGIHESQEDQDGDAGIAVGSAVVEVDLQCPVRRIGRGSRRSVALADSSPPEVPSPTPAQRTSLDAKSHTVSLDSPLSLRPQSHTKTGEASE